VIRFEILLYAKKVPACGYSTYQVIPHKTLKTYPAEVQQLPCGMKMNIFASVFSRMVH
jgi:hypothetical protein